MKIQSVKHWHTLLGGMAIIPICNRLAIRLFVSGIICCNQWPFQDPKEVSTTYKAYIRPM